MAVVLPSGDRLRLVGVSVTPGPFLTLGVMVAERVTVPLKPFRLVSTTVELADWPLMMVREDGLVRLAKAGGGAVDEKLASRTFSGSTPPGAFGFLTGTRMLSLPVQLQPTRHKITGSRVGATILPLM